MRVWNRSLVVVSVAVFVGSIAAGAAAKRVVGGFHYVRLADPPRRSLRTGDELVMIYIGQASCSWCNRAGFAEEVREVKEALGHRAAATGFRFVTEGVALDPTITSGLRHLSKFGAFDQISVGGGWANEFAFKYFWNEIPGPPATPTLLVIHRAVQVPDSTSNDPLYSANRGELLVRKVGLFEIQAWIKAGVPLPTPPPTPRSQSSSRVGRHDGSW